MLNKLYIGIDPDLRLLNAAIVTDQKKPMAVFLRRNTVAISGTGDSAVSAAARMACRLVEDVIAYLVATPETNAKQIVLVIESQNVQYTGYTNAARKQNMIQLAQVAGCLMGAFSNMSNGICLLQPSSWKGQIPKPIHHKRIYRELGIIQDAQGVVKNLFPKSYAELSKWSANHINPGDFEDINDSFGLALFGAEHRL
jgi:hypothetical protein